MELNEFDDFEKILYIATSQVALRFYRANMTIEEYLMWCKAIWFDMLEKGVDVLEEKLKAQMEADLKVKVPEYMRKNL